MNWQKEAVQDLRAYLDRKSYIDTAPERLKALEEDFAAAKAAASDKAPVQGGDNRMEDSLINNIVKRQRMEHTYQAAKVLVELTEQGLNGLDSQQRMVLDRFYINRRQGHVERLCEELGYEQAQVYRLKNDALYRFTIAMYGIIDY